MPFFQPPLGNQGNLHSSYRCPRCQLYISIHHDQCRHCGADITADMREEMLKKFRRNRWIYQTIATVLGAVLILLFLAWSNLQT